jgi:hypothetical protein
VAGRQTAHVALLLAFADATDTDAEVALETALEKYERRLDDGETPASGE